jgi:spoIIIJ-associated protein
VSEEELSPELSVEASGETVGEAKWKALRELELRLPGVDKGHVRFQVISEGERGLLGVGYAPARVLAVADPGAVTQPTPREGESDIDAHLRGVVERVVGAMGLGARVETDDRAEELLVTCTGGDLGLLIGRHGQTIDSLQYVLNAIVWRLGGGKPVTVDAAGYRERRRAMLEGIAVQSAERALRGEQVALEPMTAVERKVVHERLKEYPGVRTASAGTEPNRYVVVEQDTGDLA